MNLWSFFLDLAQIFTAIAAVAALVLSTLISLKAVRIARADNGQARQSFLYSQMTSVLESALLLDEAASVEPNEIDSRVLSRNLSQFRTHLKMLTSGTSESKQANVAETIVQCATAIQITAIALQELEVRGPRILEPYLLDGNDSETHQILKQLSSIRSDWLAFEAYVETDEKFDQFFADNPFDDSPEMAKSIRSGLNKDGVSWRPSVDVSIRLIQPWLRCRLGLLDPQSDIDGNIVGFSSAHTRYNYWDELRDEEIEGPAAALSNIEPWLDKWDGWTSINWQGRSMKPFRVPHAYPVDILWQLQTDLRADFLETVTAFISEVGEEITKQPPNISPQENHPTL